jgi:DNA-binding XRE family transcriptional regulator
MRAEVVSRFSRRVPCGSWCAGARVQRHRLNRNITQDDLAAHAGVSRTVVQRLEQGRTRQRATGPRSERAGTEE